MTLGSGIATLAAVLLLSAAAVGWHREAAPMRLLARPAPVLDGSVLFRAKGCATCHSGPDTEARIEGPPDLSDARAWAGRRRPGLSAAAYLRQSVRDPGVFISPAFRPNGGPMAGMPTLSVSDAEVDALVAYLLAR